MKKSQVAVSIIIVLGVAWTGASWYMGGKIENRIHGETDRVNAQIAQYFKNNDIDANVKVELRNYEKGIFSSDANLAVLISQTNATDPKDNLKVEEILFDTKVDHGPFPISDVAKLNLMPKLAALNNTLVKTDTTKKLFELTADKSPLALHTSLGFDGAVSGSAVISSIDYTDNNDKSNITSTPITLNFASDKDGKNISSDIKGEQFVITQGANDKFTVKNISGSLTGTKVAGDQYMFNDQSITLGELVHTGDDKASEFSMKDLALKTNSEIKDKLFYINQDYTFKSLSVGGLDFGAGKFAYSIDKADPDAMLLLTKVYNNSLLPWNKNKLGSSELVEQAVRDVLEKGLIFRIDEASLTNSAGASKLNFNIDLNAFKVDEFDKNDKKPSEIFNSLFKNIDFNVSLSMPMLEEFRNTTQYLDAARYSKEPLNDEKKAEIKATTTKDINQLKTELQQNINQISQDEKEALPLMTLSQDGKSLDLKLNYAADKFTMNGKTYSFDEFMNVTQAPQMLGLAAMLIGAGASSYGSYDDDADYPAYSEEEITEDPAIIEEQEIVIPENK